MENSTVSAIRYAKEVRIDRILSDSDDIKKVEKITQRDDVKVALGEETIQYFLL